MKSSYKEAVDLEVLGCAARKAVAYLQNIRARRVAPDAAAVRDLDRLTGELPEDGSEPWKLIEILDRIGSPATVATAGGRYFGYVIGGALPAGVAASWLASAWDQNGALRAMSPVAAALEDAALGWIRELLGLPPASGGALVTGATMANFTCLAAARHSLLERAGWDVEKDGLFGAPPLSVVVGDEVHISVIKALGMLGLGRERLIRVPADRQGRIRPDKLPKLDSRTLICIQAGNVNTGAFDPAGEVCERAREAGAWVHVDGAFGLWAAASPRYRHLTHGFDEADSWATDAHKWANVGYDCGIAMVRRPQALQAAMAVGAAYIQPGTQREPSYYAPEMSRRARGVELWAALQSLGRSGIADLIERTCAHARRFAEGLREAGYRILNDVVINQVLVSFGSAGRTRSVIERLQREGTCWCAGTEWQGQVAMRISVSSWATTAADVEASLAAMRSIAAEVSESPSALKNNNS
ncbi:MAG: aspartate aminotransferase family protein [Acidobacteriia bacterium]|nr:aspartate aminotransferase family protein [Terriglobia bacterium]